MRIFGTTSHRSAAQHLIFPNPYKTSKGRQLGVQNMILHMYLSYSLEGLIIIIYATIANMNNLRKSLQVTLMELNRKTLGF